jgi:hypothetical protein
MARKQTPDGQPLRLDERAASADADLPAFVARPPDAPVYHGFSVLPGSERDGFAFGMISGLHAMGPTRGGDAFVIAPNGSRAGIVWEVGEGEPSVVCPPSATRWGVYSFYFEGPITSEADLVRQLHSILPVLKAYWAASCK